MFQSMISMAFKNVISDDPSSLLGTNPKVYDRKSAGTVDVKYA